MAHPSGAKQTLLKDRRDVRKEPPTCHPSEELAKQLLTSATVSNMQADNFVQQLAPALAACNPRLHGKATFAEALSDSGADDKYPACGKLLAKLAEQQLQGAQDNDAIDPPGQQTPKRAYECEENLAAAKVAKQMSCPLTPEGRKWASAVEVFSGTGILSRALTSHGFQIMAVDHQPRSSLVPVVRLDLCKDAHQQLLRQELESNLPEALHIAPPCSTSSRAREKPKPKRLARLGVPTPQPLRSGLHPLGLPTLKPGSVTYERVQAANKLYCFCFELMVWALGRGVAFTIESPANSWMWSVFAWLAREETATQYHKFRHLLLEVIFDACQHGGTRPKATKLLTNCDLFASLRARCKNDHPHEPWGAQWTETGWTFATHLEAAYPLLLAERMAATFAKHAVNVGAVLRPIAHDWRAQVLALQGRQNRKSPVLLSEFAFIRPCGGQMC